MDNIQTVIRLGLPKDMHLHPGQLRDCLARDKPGKTVDDIFFHRNSDRGTPKQGRPPIRIIGGGTWVGVMAEPGYGSELLKHLPYLLQTARAEVGMLTVQIEETEVACIQLQEDYLIYYLKNMAIRRRGTPRVTNTPEFKEHRIRECLLGEMAPFFLAKNLDVEDEVDLKVELVKERSMTSLFSGETDPNTQEGRRRETMDLVDARICMNVKLNGIWQLGSLRSRGYGRLFRDLPVGSRAQVLV